LERNTARTFSNQKSDLYQIYSIDLINWKFNGVTNENFHIYKGWADLTFQLLNDGVEIRVSFLVTNGAIDNPILGTNANEHLADKQSCKELGEAFLLAIPTKDKSTINELVSLMKYCDLEEEYLFKSPNTSIKITGGKSTVIHCRMKKGYTEHQVPLLLEPHTLITSKESKCRNK